MTTSTRLYAVGAVLLSISLPLSACSRTGSLGGSSTDAASTSTSSPTVYPTPALLVTHEQARSIAKAGQRLADRRTAENITDEWFAFDFCRRASELSVLDAKAWSTASHAEPSERPPSSHASSNVESERIGRTFTQVVVLDSSPASMAWAAEKFERAEVCAEFEGIPVKTREIAVPGATLSLVRTHRHITLVGSLAHTAMAGALVENLLLTCVADAATEHLALSTATSCLSDMAQAVPKAPPRR